ncbi:hypothetical protein ACP52Y_004154 [Vibrio vulnificus]|nr:hypothetical protein [Vibrio vulnificus]EHK9186434.1 hypothetical protein [Vibrio vulnificus]EHU4850554.1 hypothetical protein [Vibrio vulnificus]EHZ2756355.1 hypothetical protein [Vibrio vulnificus]EHZ2765444.1 hypothetical protein [Vibrio vulnificus]
MTRNLEQKSVDYVVSAAKGIFGAMPVFGPALAEIISEIVPNQRIERIVEVLKELDRRLTIAEKSSFSSNKYALSIFEDGMYQAARSLSEERNRYIAMFLKGCSSLEEDSFNIKKKLFYILEELTDLDIKILLGMEHRTGNYNLIVTPSPVTYGEYESFNATQKYEYDSAKEAWNLHLSTLLRHGLIEPQYEKFDIREPYAHLDENTGMPRIVDYTVSNLGSVFIRSIGHETWKLR